MPKKYLDQEIESFVLGPLIKDSNFTKKVFQNCIIFSRVHDMGKIVKVLPEISQVVIKYENGNSEQLKFLSLLLSYDSTFTLFRKFEENRFESIDLSTRKRDDFYGTMSKYINCLVWSKSYGYGVIQNISNDGSILAISYEFDNGLTKGSLGDEELEIYTTKIMNREDLINLIHG